MDLWGDSRRHLEKGKLFLQNQSCSLSLKRHLVLMKPPLLQCLCLLGLFKGHPAGPKLFLCLHYNSGITDCCPQKFKIADRKCFSRGAFRDRRGRLHPWNRSAALGALDHLPRRSWFYRPHVRGRHEREEGFFFFFHAHHFTASLPPSLLLSF